VVERALGLVSATLEAEVLREVRRRGTVVWLDKDGTFTGFVDALIARNPTEPILAFRGSFLELLLALDPHTNGLDARPLLVHMPGFTEQSIRDTPVLELYALGSRYRKALDTLVREAAVGRALPAEVDRLLASPGLTLERADEWLGQQLTGTRDGLGALLEQMSLAMVGEALLGTDTFLRQRVQMEAELDVLRAYLAKHTGMDEAWLSFYRPRQGKSGLGALADAFAAWILSVEYVHDLVRPPHLAALLPLRALSRELVDACCSAVKQLRTRHPETYAQRAKDTEERLFEELAAGTAEELGKIDTFRVEEARVLEASIAALGRGEWQQPRAWAQARPIRDSFWLERDIEHRFEWSLVASAAALGEALAQAPRPLAGARDLTEALERYTTAAFTVDRTHRHFEQLRLALLESKLPHFAGLQAAVGVLRRAYRTWADELARDFSALMRAHGFLPDPSLRQRTWFDQVVVPLVNGGERVAVFLVDALRFEMGADLADALRARGFEVELKARYAELPSITAVGMNALAPVATGEGLTLATEGFVGFKTGEYSVRKPDDRARAMGLRALGHTARMFTLSEVVDTDTATLKRKLGGEPLVIIASRELDDLGEANVGLTSFELILRHLEAAWHHLESAGLKRCVFTSDHGFLLQDETTAVVRYGSTRDPSRRHILAADARSEPGALTVSLAALGYRAPSGGPASGHLLFREDTAVFETPSSAGASFVHGGNSLQERVVPVLSVSRKRPVAAGKDVARIEARREDDILGMPRVALRLVHAPTELMLPLGTPRPFDLALRAAGRPEVRVTLKEAPRATVRNGRIALPIREVWTEVIFTLEGPDDARVRLEVFHPDAPEAIAPVELDAWFDVAGTRATAARPSTRPAPAASIDESPRVANAESPEAWLEAFQDPGVRKVFIHLDKHGAITEVEATEMLGSPRALRRFSVDFEAHAQKLPFRVRIEAAASGKRYVRVGST
jgi:hypothetical protein